MRPLTGAEPKHSRNGRLRCASSGAAGSTSLRDNRPRRLLEANIMNYVLFTMYHVLWTMYYVVCIMYQEICTMVYVLCTMYYVSCIMYYVLYII